jgi:hypothetical protein
LKKWLETLLRRTKRKTKLRSNRSSQLSKLLKHRRSKLRRELQTHRLPSKTNRSILRILELKRLIAVNQQHHLVILNISTVLLAKRLAIRARDMMRMDVQGISTIHLEKSCVTWLSNRITIISMEIRVNSTLSNKSIKLNSADIGWIIKLVHFSNTVNLPMVKKI